MLARSTIESVANILDSLRTTTHNGFPVFADKDSAEDDVVTDREALVGLGKARGKGPEEA
jgi:hypothetical protein